MKKYRDMTEEEREIHHEQKEKRHKARLQQEIIDRQLDIEIAKTIFGYKKIEHKLTLINCDIIDTYEDVLQVYNEDDGYEYWVDLPCYSTDIGAAFSVLEILKYTFTISNNNQFECRLKNVVADGPTLPIAICKAVLLEKKLK